MPPPATGQPTASANGEGFDLSSEHIVLTPEVLNPWSLPTDGVYLQVLAYVTRADINGQSSFAMMATDPDEDLCSVPFEGVPEGHPMHQALEELPIVEVPRNTTSRASDAEQTQCNIRASGAEQRRSNTRARGTGARDNVERSVNANAETSDEDRHDRFLSNLFSAAITHLLASPSTFEGAKEVYIVRVPYITVNLLTIRFLVRKEVHGVAKAFLATPAIAYYPIRAPGDDGNA